MNKIYLPASITFLIGMIVTVIGSLFKIMHWPKASILLILGMFSEVVGIILFSSVLLKNKR